MSEVFENDDSHQQALTGERATPESHLSKRYTGDGNNLLSADKRREYWCKDCDYRVTRSPSGEGEYGHDRECEHHYVLGEDHK